MTVSMGNCLPWVHGKQRKDVSLLLVGLDNAGKTTAAKRVQGGPIDNVAPTVGYSSEHFKFGKFDVTMIDLGGGRRIRDIWKNYLAEVHAVVYVVDSSDVERIEECRDEFSQLLSNPLIKEKPVLLFANKQDKVGALDEPDICDHLNLEEIVNDNRCLCRVEMCAAIQNKNNRAMKDGMTWLLGVIGDKYESLNLRVQNDVFERDAQLKVEREARNERVRKRREEREKKEAEEAGSQITEPINNDGIVSTPFKEEQHNQSRRLSANDMSAQSVRSGLGDELMDDDQFSLPGSVVLSKHSLRGEDSCTESYRNNSSRMSEIVRDTPTISASSALTGEVASNASDDTKATKTGRKSKRTNKVNPLNPHPHATMLAPLKPRGKLTPLGSQESSQNTVDSEADAGKLADYNPLPPLKLDKPNVESDDDIVM